MSDTHWTDETDREADTLYRTFTDAKIRRYQDLADQQITMAYAQRESRPAAMEAAMTDLNRMRDALTREMMRRCDNRARRAARKAAREEPS